MFERHLKPEQSNVDKLFSPDHFSHEESIVKLPNKHTKKSLIPSQVEGSRSRKTSLFYVGKRCVFVFKGASKQSSPTNSKHKSRVRAIWGKVTRMHGNNGSVRARFTKNLPPSAIGHRVRIVSSIDYFYICHPVLIAFMFPPFRCSTHPEFKHQVLEL